MVDVHDHIGYLLIALNRRWHGHHAARCRWKVLRPGDDAAGHLPNGLLAAQRLYILGQDLIDGRQRNLGFLVLIVRGCRVVKAGTWYGMTAVTGVTRHLLLPAKLALIEGHHH